MPDLSFFCVKKSPVHTAFFVGDRQDLKFTVKAFD